MKVEMENLPIEHPGVAVESETPVEAQRLRSIWDNHGGLAEMSKLPDGNIRLAIAPSQGQRLAPKLFEALKGMVEFWEKLDKKYPDLDTEGISGFDGSTDYVGRARVALSDAVSV